MSLHRCVHTHVSGCLTEKGCAADGQGRGLALPAIGRPGGRGSRGRRGGLSLCPRPAILPSPPHRLTQCPGHPGLPEPRVCLGPSSSLRTGGRGSEERQPSGRGLAGRGQPRRSSVRTDPGTCMHIMALKNHCKCLWTPFLSHGHMCTSSEIHIYKSPGSWVIWMGSV